VKGQIAVALLVRGRDHAEHGKLDQAREDFERSIRYQETPEGHVYLARLHQVQGEFDSAFAEYTRALDLDENLPAIHENLGSYFMDIQDFEQAAKAFANALAIGATGREAYIGLWRANVALGRLDRAHEAIMDALAKAPEDDVVLTVAGMSCHLRRETEQAQEHWEHAVRVNPKNVDAHFHLAGLAAQEGRREEALDLIRRCVALDAARTKALWKQEAGSPHPRFSHYFGDEDFLDALG
jgi:tetratricopeptide (TPR) repeat protein